MARRADLYALLAAAALHRHAAAQQHVPQPDMPPPGFGAQPRNAPLSHNLGGIHWGGGLFDNPAQLVAWMNARGGNTSVGQFLGNHPGLGAQFGQRGAMSMTPRQQGPSVLAQLGQRPPRPLQQQVQRHVRQQYPRTAQPY